MINEKCTVCFPDVLSCFQGHKYGANTLNMRARVYVLTGPSLKLFRRFCAVTINMQHVT